MLKRSPYGQDHGDVGRSDPTKAASAYIVLDQPDHSELRHNTDSVGSPPVEGIRSAGASFRQLLHGADDYWVDLQIEPQEISEKMALLGQVLPKTAARNTIDLVSTAKYTAFWIIEYCVFVKDFIDCGATMHRIVSPRRSDCEAARSICLGHRVLRFR